MWQMCSTCNIQNMLATFLKIYKQEDKNYINSIIQISSRLYALRTCFG